MYVVRLEDGRAVQQIKARVAPDGWIETAHKVALGSTWDGSTFTPPPPPPDPTPQELEAEVQALAATITHGADRDKALAFVLADLVAKSFNLPTQEARQMVRDRFVAHLRTIKGL